MPIHIRQAMTEDIDQMGQMIQEAGLDPIDIGRNLETFLVGEDVASSIPVPGPLIAMVGWEHYGTMALLRTFVIRKHALNLEQSMGVLELAVSTARDRGVHGVYLRTQQPPLFEQLGWTAIEEADIPMELLSSPVFGIHKTGSCVMVKALM